MPHPFNEGVWHVVVKLLFSLDVAFLQEMGSTSKVVAVLVVWAVIVTIWMVLLSTGGSWTQCPQGRDEENRRAKFAHWSPEPADLVQQEPTELASPSDETTTSSTTTINTVLDEKLSSYFSRIMHRPPPPEWEGVGNGSREENCTVVLLAHEQDASMLYKVLIHYCRISFLQKILVVWNTNASDLPYAVRGWEHRCTASEVKFILTNDSKPSNRYLPWKKIETDCVAFIDDSSLVSVYDMIFGYEVWQNFRYQVVGFQESSFSRKSNGNYTYEPHQWQRQIGIKYKTGPSKSKIEVINGTRILHVGSKTYILGAHPTKQSGPTKPPAMEGYSIMQVPAFVHRVYLEMYFDPDVVPAGAVEYVEELGNCEDILLNIVVTKFLHDMNMAKSGALLMKNSMAMKKLSGSKGRIDENPANRSERSRCLNKFSQIYGHLHLQLSNTIATLV